MPRYVILGGGVAATRAAETVRSLRPEDPVTLIAEEDRPFYMRPLLADYVAGRLEEGDLWLKFEAAAAERSISLLLGRRATGLDYRKGRSVVLSDGEKVPFDLLLIATGAKPSLPQIPGVELEGVTTFNTYADAVRVRAWAEKAKRAVVVGRGLQAVELARGLRLRGLDVCMVAPDETPWFLPLFQTTQEDMERVLGQHGVEVVVLDAAAEILGQGGKVTGLRTREGRELAADIVGFAHHQQARMEVLEGSDIGTEEGVLTDRHLRTTDEAVFAAGDVAQIQVDGERRALGYGWMRASAQGEAAARNMCGEQVATAVGDEFQAQALYGMSLTARWR